MESSIEPSIEIQDVTDYPQMIFKKVLKVINNATEMINIYAPLIIIAGEVGIVAYVGYLFYNLLNPDRSSSNKTYASHQSRMVVPNKQSETKVNSTHPVKEIYPIKNNKKMVDIYFKPKILSVTPDNNLANLPTGDISTTSSTTLPKSGFPDANS